LKCILFVMCALWIQQGGDLLEYGAMFCVHYGYNRELIFWNMGQCSVSEFFCSATSPIPFYSQFVYLQSHCILSSRLSNFISCSNAISSPKDTLYLRYHRIISGRFFIAIPKSGRKSVLCKKSFVCLHFHMKLKFKNYVNINIFLWTTVRYTEVLISP
jgi:hypothetical protein